MKKITKKILGYICITPLAAGMSYWLYKITLLAISDPIPWLHTLGGFAVIFGILGLFVLGFHLISN